MKYGIKFNRDVINQAIYYNSSILCENQSTELTEVMIITVIKYIIKTKQKYNFTI